MWTPSGAGRDGDVIRAFRGSLAAPAAAFRRAEHPHLPGAPDTAPELQALAGPSEGPGGPVLIGGVVETARVAPRQPLPCLCCGGALPGSSLRWGRSLRMGFGIREFKTQTPLLVVTPRAWFRLWHPEVLSGGSLEQVAFLQGGWGSLRPVAVSGHSD